MTRGLPLFVGICLLAVMPMLYPPLGSYAVAVLFVGWFGTLFSVKRATRAGAEDPAKPQIRGSRSA